MLELKHLNYLPPQHKQPLWQNLTLQMYPGKIYGLIGVNGVGKTTLLNLLSGLITPTQGDVYWQQQPIHRSKKALRTYLATVGYCLQDADHLFFKQTVQEELEYHHKGSMTQIIEKLQLETLLELSPFELSGGQKKRLALAIMLLKQPQMLFCDEITAGLDTHFQDVVMSLLQDYCQEHLVLLVTHNLDEALKYCDELLFLDQSGLHAYTTAAVLKQPEIFEQFQLLMPRSLEICQALMNAGILPSNSYYRSDEEIAQALATLWNKGTNQL
ncbi:MAG: ABC transporter ATP-binding protein [Lactobacillus sp.]|nr:ABC transporter ATP-binding protein [Lactobacillus sp.]